MQTLIIPTREVGLFSDFYTVLGWCGWAEERGLAPVAFWNRRSLYAARGFERGHRGRVNLWESFFEPLPGGPSAALGLDDPRYATATPADLMKAFAGRAHVGTDYLTDIVGIPFVYSSPAIEARGRELLARYVRLRPEVSRAVVAAWARIKTGARRVVGVHYRGTDKCAEVCLVGHGRCMDALREAMADPRDIAFVATDDAAFLQKSRAEFGARVRFLIGAKRSATQAATHAAGATPKDAEDALTDALLLARCDLLLHGSSNLAGAVKLWAPAMPCVDLRHDAPAATAGLPRG